jgi:hypothetical protein
MTSNKQLLREIRAFCKAARIAETTFGQRAVHEWRLVERLEAGRSITLTTAERVRNFIRDNQPEPEGRRVA